MEKEGQLVTEELIQLVSFRLGEESFGVDILCVQEINRMVDITRLPETPHYCEGVINLRGRVIPIIDTRKRFNMPAVERDKNTRIIVCDVDGSLAGMIVDAVEEVLRIPGSTLEAPPPIVTSLDSDYIQGVARIDGRLLMFVDVNELVSTINKEVAQVEAMPA
ncbi:MAG: chemotaxis protein CheW [candidate division Zixibacteria bacterium]|nr:chemotaxis protein CheW [candidate division Zixibacteria bacterium]